MDKQVVKSHLNLRAIVPALAELARKDEKARTLATGPKGTMMLSLLHGPSVLVDFGGDGTIRVEEGSKLFPSVGLFFPSSGLLNRVFDNKGGAPIPWGGVWNIKLIKAFDGTSKRLGEIMVNPDLYLKDNPDDLFKVMSILFGIAMRGVKVLSDIDHHAASYIAAAPEGVAVFRLGSGAQELAVHFVNKGGTLTLHEGKPARFNAELYIPNLRDAYELFRGRLDALAAVGLGKVEMKGSLMLLDNINAVLDRLATYLV